MKKKKSPPPDITVRSGQTITLNQGHFDSVLVEPGGTLKSTSRAKIKSLTICEDTKVEHIHMEDGSSLRRMVIRKVVPDRIYTMNFDADGRRVYE